MPTNVPGIGGWGRTEVSVRNGTQWGQGARERGRGEVDSPTNPTPPTPLS